MQEEFIVVIPARYKSSRFPGKPLTDISGKSMIRRVWERCCLAVDKQRVYVATDDDRIAAHCAAYGMQYLMTSEECLTGTDRVYEASKIIDAKFYVNVQGDEPLLDPQDILDVVVEANKRPNEVINAMCPIYDEEDFRSPSVPKVVVRPDGRLLYMSRASIPTTKKLEFSKASKQVCIYSFPKEALKVFASVKQKTFVESIEDIEILRFLELGYDVRMIEVSSASIAVDFPEDVSRVEEVISNGFK
ncbi:3-deoxy-manno-octulosonate cytidylyltransferase [Vibrio sp. T11.5]|uniref:3-deoxy-manno-octulosonate cytidylyltransferase n=1 Tax=Vibrio sp. T11.5 TaxID=2998836 RepID=UPI0022CD3DB0|nr:3-deoxy-manno-octulosonate cytidylyltransferase [Vibrio sp. T11.5]MDA0119784.1 3-deoxy-manno-octulosonate cytidylyltransferase [Vibrio sp. T11.5]